MSDQSPPPQHGAPGTPSGWPAPGAAAPGPAGGPAGPGGYGHPGVQGADPGYQGAYPGYQHPYAPAVAGQPGAWGPYGAPPVTAGAAPGMPGMPPGWPVRPPRNKPGKASMILGIVAAVLAVTVLGSLFGVSLGLLALFFGVVGRRRARHGGATNSGQALAGLITGGCAVVISVVLIVTVLVPELRRDVPPHGSVALTSSRGDSDAPLSARTTATYDDGTWVTVGPARPFDPPADAGGHSAGRTAYAVDVTVAETGGRSLPLTDYSWLATAVDTSGGEHDLKRISADSGPLSRDFPSRVASGDRVTVEFAFDIPDDTDHLRFGFRPEPGFGKAYWELDVTG